MTLFLKKSRTYEIPKNRPFLSEIQNNDAYPLTGRVEGPGPDPSKSLEVVL